MSRLLVNDALFWDRTQPAPPSECLLWTGATNGRLGYGKVRANGRAVYAHRMAYELAFGVIPAGLCVLHRCDVPACVNPAHLCLGTMRDNTADAARKGRLSSGTRHSARILHRRRGVNNPQSKLTPELASTIRALSSQGESNESLGQRFGVARATVWAIVNGKTWQ